MKSPAASSPDFLVISIEVTLTNRISFCFKGFGSKENPAFVWLSPKRLGRCERVGQLIDMIFGSVKTVGSNTEYDFWTDSAFEYFEDSERDEQYSCGMLGGLAFRNHLEEIEQMDYIRRIMISCEESNWTKVFSRRSYLYDRFSGEYSASIQGCLDGVCGELLIPDEDECDVSFQMKAYHFREGDSL